MKIAIFASAFHPHFGGVEELCRQLALEYLRRGLEVIVVTNRWPRDLPAKEMLEGITIYRTAMRAPDGDLKTKANYYLTRNSLDKEMLQILRQEAVDVIHIQCISSNGLYALNSAKKLSLPLIATMQGELTMDATQLYERSEYARQTLRDVLDGADIVTGCSQKTLDDGQNFYGKPFGERGVVVFNGARIEDFDGGQPYQHSRPYIFAIGRVVPQKGFDVLIRAFAQADVGDHDLLIAGDGSERAALEQLSKEMGVEKRVFFPGKADHDMAVSLFRGASFFVLPSRADEGLPVVVAEALAAGKAIVATRSGGTPEAIIDGETGLIVEKEDVAGLAQAISRVAKDSELRRVFGERAKARSHIFGWKAIADNYIGLYNALLARSASR